MIKIDSFNYLLPPELIAQEPANPRESSRLLVFDSRNNQLVDDLFSNLGNYISNRDLIVVNNSKVMPARIIGKKSTGGKIEFLLIEQINENWTVLIGGKTAVGDEIQFSPKLSAKIIEKKDKEGLVNFNIKSDEFWAEIKKIGQAPIPPYIKKNNQSRKQLIDEYQTVYAENYGSAAAPTAGLHFSDGLIKNLKKKKVDFATVDLRVGLGTFAPLEEKNLKLKKLHNEKFTIPPITTKKILLTRKNQGRIIAVGTTSVRALESAAESMLAGNKQIFGETEIFIQPGDKFKIVDCLITNFHLPKSSLMMLVAAFLDYKGLPSGEKKLLEIYRYAIEKKYRFYSFGDAMLII